MAESAEEIYARVRAVADADGRLPVPSYASWPTFPWDVADGRLVTRPLAPPADEEPREGEGDRPCGLCAGEVEGVIWTDDRWRLRHLGQRSGMPLVLMLEPLAHLDFPDLDDQAAAEYGVLAARIARAVEGRPNIARCHVMRIGDGASHLHVWFLGRPERLPSARGSFAVEWDDILPAGPEEPWRADLEAVAATLAAQSGRPVG